MLGHLPWETFRMNNPLLENVYLLEKHEINMNDLVDLFWGLPVPRRGAVMNKGFKVWLRFLSPGT